MIRPWYRSRLFWLSLPGWVFLLWGWLAFPHHDTLVNWTRGDRGLSVGDRSRVLSLGWVNSGPSVRFPQGLHVSATRKSPASGPMNVLPQETRLFPPAFGRQDHHFAGGIRSSHVSVSYWLLLLAYGSSWLLVLYTRQRWKFARHAEHAGEPPP